MVKFRTHEVDGKPVSEFTFEETDKYALIQTEIEASDFDPEEKPRVFGSLDILQRANVIAYWVWRKEKLAIGFYLKQVKEILISGEGISSVNKKK